MLWWLLLQGCTSPCVGVGCEDEYPSAQVGVMVTLNNLDRPPSSPQQVVLSVTGAETDGADWTMILSDGLLLIGNPVGKAVYSFGPESSGASAPEDARGTLYGASTDGGFGSALAFLPTTDGTDLLVGAEARDLKVTTREEGVVYRFSGLGEGFTGELSAAALAGQRVYGEDVGGHFGAVVAACGDMDGDGAADWAASAPRDSSGQVLAGLVSLVLSGTLPADQLAVPAREAGRFWVGSTVGEQAGVALRCVDDFTGDGVPDLLIGAPFADRGGLDASGAVYMLDGATSVSGPLFDAALQTLSGITEESWLGWSLDTGDLNGDGYPEVVAGAPGARTSTGEVLIWDGAELLAGETLPRFRLVGETAGDTVGQAVRIVDLDGGAIWWWGRPPTTRWETATRRCRAARSMSSPGQRTTRAGCRCASPRAPRCSSRWRASTCGWGVAWSRATSARTASPTSGC